ncbi:MAG: DUF1329 domain-containing protein [Oceanococcus sp.]
MHRTIAILTSLLCLIASTTATAKVTPEEAAELGKSLTPLGAIKSGNADSSIPAWDGGYKLKRTPPDSAKRNPKSYPGMGDQNPVMTINSGNMANYADKLTEGHKIMLARYPNSYKLPVYPTVRSAYAPQYVYDATYKNALNADTSNGGESIRNAVGGTPFPIPIAPLEIIWNHKTRYRGQSIRRYNTQLAVQTSGSFMPHKLREDVLFSYSDPKATADSLNGVMTYFLQVATSPPRAAGQVLLVHETMDQLQDTRRAWLYNPGQRRVRRAPNVAYDNPGSGSDGLRTNDQLDVYNGATDRYRWKLLGKKEFYVPYNAIKLADDSLEYEDIIRPSHANQDLMRYELHRVWVVDSFLREGTNHVYKRRTFYVDEDSWTILMVDIYDNRDQLWRIQEYHQMTVPWLDSVGPAGHMIYDLQSNRYLAMEFSNEEPLFEAKDFKDTYFRTNNVRKIARR